MFPDLMKSDEGFKTFRVLNESIEDDGYGGTISVYRRGATFEAVLNLDDSLNAQIAQAQGVKGVYTLTCEKSLNLPWRTVFCVADDETNAFRVTTKEFGNATPGVSALNLRQVNAEDFELQYSIVG